MAQVVPGDLAVRTVPQQRNQENQEDLVVLEVQEDLEDLLQSLLENQEAPELQAVQEAQEVRVGLVVLEVQVDLEVQMVPRLQLQGQACRRKSQPQGNRALQADQEALKGLVDPVAQEDQVCDTERVFLYVKRTKYKEIKVK